jgi:uncharacterized membrane protein
MIFRSRVLAHRNERWAVDIHGGQQLLALKKSLSVQVVQAALSPHQHDVGRLLGKIAVWRNTLGWIIRMAHDSQQFNAISRPLVW